jgi:neutral trehalase
MQWLAINGLAAYGEDGLARDIARCWLRKNVDAYEESAYSWRSTMSRQ